MPSSPAIWRELSRSTKSECPKLFYSFSTKQNSLIIKLTDLVVVWECSLDRNGIIDAARAQQSSIDPSESNSQLRVLLEKLEQSLNSGANRLSRSTDLEAQTIYLNTELDLPRPLKPLSWTFELNPEDAAELAEQLLRPCLHEASVAKQKVESLIRVIKDKDHVLSRLLEKVDSSAIDLSLIFPGITGLRSRKGRVTTKEAQKHVPGMSEFDQTKWNSEFDSDTPYAGFHQMGMDNLVAGCEKCPKHTVKQHADWLKRLPIRGSRTETVNIDTDGSAKRKSLEPHQSDTSADTESDFERQPTPPHIKNTRPRDKRPQSSSSPNSTSSLDERMSRPTKKVKLGQVGGLGNRTKSGRVLRQGSTSSELKSSTIDKLTFTKSAREKEQMNMQNSDSETETASEVETDPKQPARDLKASFPWPSEHSQKRAQSGNLGRLASQSSRAQSEVSRSSSSAGRNHERSPSTQAQSSLARPDDYSPPERSRKFNILRSSKSSQQQSDKINSQTASKDDGNKDKDAIVQSTQNPFQQEQSNRITDDPDNDAKQPATPNRKLGRLKNPRSGSAASTENTIRTPIRNKEKDNESPSKQPGTKEIDTDSETASEVEADNDNKATQPIDDTPIPTALARNMPRLKHSLSSSTSTPDPETNTNPNSRAPETAQEKADRRREELKKRLKTAGSVRRVRKF